MKRSEERIPLTHLRGRPARREPAAGALRGGARQGGLRLHPEPQGPLRQGQIIGLYLYFPWKKWGIYVCIWITSSRSRWSIYSCM